MIQRTISSKEMLIPPISLVIPYFPHFGCHFLKIFRRKTSPKTSNLLVEVKEILKELVFQIILFFPKGINPINKEQQSLKSTKKIKLQPKIIQGTKSRAKELEQHDTRMEPLEKQPIINLNSFKTDCVPWDISLPDAARELCLSQL